MTAGPARRRRATRLALATTAFALLIVVTAGFVGARALYNSTDGRDAAGPDRELVPMPDTPSVLIGVEGEQGTLTSLAVFTLLPQDEGADGSTEPGGSIISLPAAAAVTHDGVELPLAERFDGDAESLGSVVSALLGVAFDDVIVLDETGLAGLLELIGVASATLPADVVVHEGTDEQQEFEAGEQQISGDDAAAILAAEPSFDGTGDDDPATAASAAVWSALAAERTEAAAPSDDEGAASSTSDDDESGPSDEIETQTHVIADDEQLAELAGKLFAGPVEARELHATPVESAEHSMVAIDRVDALLVFGQISPRKVVAPFPSYNVRVVAPFADEDVSDGTSADVAHRAIGLLVEDEVNVVSVSSTAGDVPAVTRLDVVNPDAVGFAKSLGEELFGEHTIGETSRNLAGIDLVITLGEGFLS